MKVLKPIKKTSSKDITDFFVLDIETWGLSPKPENLAFGVIYQPNYYKVFYNREQLDIILNQRRFRNKKIFAHNAEFDLSGIFGNIYKNVDPEAIFNNRFISARYKDVYFFDSFNLIPFSLEKIGKELGFEKMKTPEKFFKTENKNIFEVEQTDIEYCVRDCEVTHLALTNFFKVTGKIKMTIGSMSMNFFRTDFLDKEIWYNEFNEKFFKSYYGGRTEAFYIGKVNAKVIDINSLYPFVMKTIKFPNTKTLKQGVKFDVDSVEKIIRLYEGCAKVTIEHFETKFGFLPYKLENKLCFPVGTFTGWWNFNELRFALLHGAIKLIEVHEYYFSVPVKSPFYKFVEFTYKKRQDEHGGFMQLVYKLLMNNLYGKFGQRKKFKKTYFEKPPFELIADLHKNKEWFDTVDLGKDREDLFLITKSTRLNKSYTAIPSFASYITSAARIYLLEYILKNSHKVNILYCDTDSIFFEGNENDLNIKIGNELGQWKVEDKNVIEIRGLKNYRVIQNGEEFDKIKGIPKRAIKIGNYYQFETYVKTASGLREIKGQSTGDNVIMKKELKGKYDKRIVLPDGSTKPLKI